MKKIVSIATAVLFTLTAATFSSCVKEEQAKAGASDNPKANAIEPGAASGNDVLTLTGNGLGDMVSIVFDKGGVPAAFNPNFNTDAALIFRVPDTANGGRQNIVFTNRKGKQVSVPFSVIALASVTEASNYNFTGGTQLTLTGNNLDDVSNVVLSGTTTAVTVGAKTKRSLVITMPATTLDRVKLDITNASGKITTTQEFVNVDKAFKFFTDGFQQGFQNASWGSDAFISTTVFKSGTSSVGKTYAAGNWHQLGFGWNQVSNDGYTFLSFWIKGASKEYPLWISSSASTGGFASFNDNAKITVPANVWTYFKLPLSQLNLWATSPTFNQLGWRIQGPNGQDETFYLDDVMLVK